MAVEPDSSGSRAAIQPAATGRGGSNPSASMEHGLGKRLMTLLRAVYHMLRKGLCRKRLMMDLHLLLGRGKLAGKALRDLLAAAHHHHHHHHNHMVVPRPSSSSGSSSSRAPSSASSSSSSALPAAATTGLSFPYDPRDVEFSCTTTPSYSFGFARGGAAHPAGPARALFPFRIRGRGPRGGSGGARAGCDGLDFAQVARALEKMHADDEAAAAAGGSGADQLALSLASPSPSVAGATPSPMLALSLGRSPAGARRLRVTDSPFPVDPPEGLDARADSTFDAFITKFYETLRLQQADATPDNC